MILMIFFKRAITRENERPPIPFDLHPSLKALMEKCWHKDPSCRPSFTEILPILDSILVDCLIDDPIGNKFWKDNFLGRDHVLWSEFINKFSDLLNLSKISKDYQLDIACLKKILTSPNKEPNPKEPDVVYLEKYSQIIRWFGPVVKEQKGFSILDNMRVLMQKDWFHGDIEKQRAEDLLSGQQKGTFLVRASITSPMLSPFTISKVSKKGKINHQRILKNQDGNFEIQIVSSSKKTKTHVSKDDSLIPLIKEISDELYLKYSCPGSVYKSLFLQTKIEGYLATDED